MMYVYSGRDEARCADIFHQMYRQRFEIYVKRRRWSGLSPVDNLEKDQYDNDSAKYLLALDEDGNVLAGLRLLPTKAPHLFKDLFAHLAEADGLPAAEDILELTRFYVAPALSSDRTAREWLIGVLAAGLFEYCLQNGIRQVSSVVDTFLLPQMRALEWNIRELGAAQSYGEGRAIGVLIDVDETALHATRRIKRLSGSVLLGRGTGPSPQRAQTLGRLAPPSPNGN